MGKLLIQLMMILIDWDDDEDARMREYPTGGGRFARPNSTKGSHQRQHGPRFREPHLQPG
ncbi:hypothetical protein D1871_21180 [Nakamurella silvestris]|nr:hypothetical protein D1871_21180 [Nakamurella silvestris]